MIPRSHYFLIALVILVISGQATSASAGHAESSPVSINSQINAYVWMSLGTFFFFLASYSSFIAGIFHILSLSAKEEMRRIYAVSPITSMKNGEVVGEFFIVDKVRSSVASNMPSLCIKPKATIRKIGFFHFISGPQPASSSFFYMLEKSLHNLFIHAQSISAGGHPCQS